MKTRPSRVLGIAVLVIASLAMLPLLLPVLGMCLLGLVTLLLPALVVLVPVLLLSPLWWLLASSRGNSAPADATASAAATSSLAPALQRSTR